MTDITDTELLKYTVLPPIFVKRDMLCFVVVVFDILFLN
jgi:hypothetical protein